MSDFTHLGIIGAPPLILVVNNRFPGRNAAGTVEALRRAPPESITYATSGVGGVLHLAAELLGQHLGTRFVHVPYRSGAQMLQSIHTGKPNRHRRPGLGQPDGAGRHGAGRRRHRPAALPDLS
ncbi:tripartite tricarboxylate transporter substrate-binding protein [Siccirubricoccus deserti]